MPLNAPHTPILPTQEWQGKSGLNNYGDFCLQVDHSVGKIVETVEQLGLADNTLIIFTADNGCSPAAKTPMLEQAGHFASGNRRGYKADIYDGGHRVPFIVRWDGKIMPRTTSEQLICLVDFLATFAEITDFDIPEQTAEDSVSILPALLGQDSEPLRTEVIHHSINGSFAIRQGNWKLCLCPDSGGWSDPKPGTVTPKSDVQLFNLKEDIAETKNLKDMEPVRIEQMKKRLQSIKKQTRRSDKQNNVQSK